MIRRSSQPFSINYSPDAVSEEDVIAVYADTLTDPSLVSMDPIDNRPHKPSTSRSPSAPTPGATLRDDFILFDFAIRNLGRFPLKQLYIGVVVDADAYHLSKGGARKAG